ncbi:hypothetical protein PIB30_095712 [Stylosanthes scabra]|uniref:Uncharacterized protein n=1 Tax=Stylosanthes scabra TaxID=79078 RepID=A0ABU6TX92_9FABA|nr:hypothetical protein [Stylosanthes scabra]
MRDILLVRPTKHPCNLLPYPVLISRLAHRYEVPEFPNDAFYNVREVDMYIPFGDWRGERVWGPDRQIARTQAMICRAFPSVDFTGLGFSSSSDDSGESQGF